VLVKGKWPFASIYHKIYLAMEYLSAHDISYIQPDKEILFENISFSVHENDKVALIGNNGAGKSTLLKILCGIFIPTHGIVKSSSNPYYLPQHFGQFNDNTIAEALQIEGKLNALHQILQGNLNNDLFATLNEDWKIEQRSIEALNNWDLKHLSLEQKMDSLSGGEKTKVFLAGITIHYPKIILLDEPTNHLDTYSRRVLYNYIKTTENILVVVSHDRVLLDMLNPIYELNKNRITVYGGNYAFYKKKKERQINALKHELKDKEKAMRVAKRTAQIVLERKHRIDSRGAKKQKGNIPSISMNKLKDSAEKKTSKLKEIHSDKIETIAIDISKFQKELHKIDEMKLNFENTSTYIGKKLVKVQDINFEYDNQKLWNSLLSFQIKSGDRITIDGRNGSGKTTLIKLILGDFQPSTGKITRSKFKAVYVDQEYSLIDNKLTIYEQAQQYNEGGLQEHEVKIRLYRYLFNRESWTKPCSILSGGEKMKLALCCLMINNKAPDIFALDEPTNNLDIQNIEILTSAVKDYKGTIIVVSHDTNFLKEIRINRKISIENKSIKFLEDYE